MAEGFSGSIIIYGFGEEAWAKKTISRNQVSNRETKPTEKSVCVDDSLTLNQPNQPNKILAVEK